MHGLKAKLLDERIAHVGQSGLPVGAQVLFHVLHDVVDDVLFRLMQLQLGQGGLVPLHHLGGRIAHGQAGRLGVVLDDVGHGMDGLVHLARA